MLTFLLDESVETAVLLLLLVSGLVGCLAPRRYDLLRQPLVIKAMSFATRFIGTVAFVLGLLGLIERASVIKWLPLLIAGLVSDLVCGIIKKAANVTDHP